MPYQRLRRPFRGYSPTERLARAISDIDKQLEQLRLAGESAPLSAYRARRILKEAHDRCRERPIRGRRHFPPHQLRGPM